MTSTRGASIPAIILLVALCGGAPPATQPAAMDEIRRLYDDRRYADVLREGSRALGMRDDVLRTRGFDRFELLRLRAETYLRLMQSASASDAFAAAARQVSQTDADRAAVLRAVSILVKRSKNNAYAPRRGKAGAEPIDLLDEASRKRAIVALYEDEAGDVAARLAALRKSESLGPIVEASARLRELADLERAARGNDGETQSRLQKLGDDARRIITTSINRMTDRVEEISRSANQRFLIQEGNIYRKRGLQGRDRDDLKDITSTCERIPDAVVKLSSDLGVESDDFAKCKDDAAKLYERARYVLNDDYSGIYTED